MENLSCSCNSCVGACKTKPGWFKPGEVELVAEFLQVPLIELFRTKLMVDWFENFKDDPDDEWFGREVFVLSPAVWGGSPGEEFPGNPKGRCVFLSHDNKCDIHPVKPFECREYIHTTTKEEIALRKEEIVGAWAESFQIEELLGRAPVSVEFGILDLIRSELQ